MGMMLVNSVMAQGPVFGMSAAVRLDSHVSWSRTRDCLVTDSKFCAAGDLPCRATNARESVEVFKVHPLVWCGNLERGCRCTVVQNYEVCRR
ncbi:hypothetical protein TNCV_4621061 [Trichonephila clavipes]|nr:hypothetical protein TNCV_4621061 [Trichonephila clavipes]